MILVPESPVEPEPLVERVLAILDIQKHAVLCVSEEMPLEEAAHMMMKKNVEQFPVVAEGAITGMLSRGDIIRKLFGR